MNRSAALLILLCLSYSAALAQSPAGPSSKAASTQGPDLTVPVDQAKEWVVGFCVFSADGLSPQNTYLAYSLPLLLKDSVSGLERHTFSQEERDGAQKAILSRARLAAEQALTSVRKERDALLFGDAPPSAATQQSIDERLDAAAARIDFLQALAPSRVEVAADKQISFKEGTSAGNLLDLQQYPSAAFSAQEGIDLLVGGSIREIQGYLLLDVWAFDAALGTTVFTSREAAQRDELYAAIPAVGKELIGTVLGRDWSLVVFAPDPPEASLFVDGSLVASGASPALYLTPGAREIKVSAPGHRDAVRTETFPSGQETRIADALEKEASGGISVSSEPPGAKLYLDSVWQGTTPFLLDRPSVRSRGVLSLTGYYDLSFSLGADAPTQLSFALQPDFGAGDAAQKQARDDFYTSFAWFAVSVPLPLLCYGAYIDYALQGIDFLARTWQTQAAEALAVSKTFLVGYYVGVALSASLFAWMVNRIIRYVTVVNGTAG